MLYHLPESSCHPFAKVHTALEVGREVGDRNGELHFLCIQGSSFYLRAIAQETKLLATSLCHGSLWKSENH